MNLQGGVTVPGNVTCWKSSSVDRPQVLNVSGDNTISGTYTMHADNGGLTVFQSDSGLLTVSGIVTLGGGTAPLYLRGAGTGEITGFIQDGATTAAISIYKNDGGTWTISGYNSTKGSLNVNAGTLALKGSSYTLLPFNSSINVSSGAVLDATNVTESDGLYVGQTAGQGLNNNGTVLGSVKIFGSPTSAPNTIAGNGTITGNAYFSTGSFASPGGDSSVGTMTVNGNVTMEDASLINYNLSGTAHDLLSVGGSLTFNSGTVSINVAPLGALSAGTYSVATVATSSNLIGNATNLAVVVGAGIRPTWTFTPSISPAGTDIQITVGGHGANLVWNGTTPTDAWDVTTSPPWLNGCALPTTSTHLMQCSLPMRQLATTVNIPAGNLLSPASVTVDSTNNYTFQGSGKITGGTGC